MAADAAEQQPQIDLAQVVDGVLASEVHILVAVAAEASDSPLVARKHDLQVTDEDFAKAVQNPVQSGSAMHRTTSQADSPAHRKTPEKQGFPASQRDSVKRKAGVDGNRTHPATFQPPHRV